MDNKKEKTGHEKVAEILSGHPRNPWEKEERGLIKELWKFVYKDARSVDAFVNLIFAYRREAARLNLLTREFGGD